MKRSSRLPRILILYTGGTLGMEEAIGESSRLKVSKLTPQALKARFTGFVPELARLVESDVQVAFNRDSAHMGFPEWEALARTLKAAFKSKKYQGVVILHGTDTLAYAASALSFMVGQTPIPVILTGAQKPLASLRSDARRNLLTAVEILVDGPHELIRQRKDRMLLNQVLVFFDRALYQGNQVSKVSAVDFDAFEAPIGGPLAVIGTGIRFLDRRAPTFAAKSKAQTFDSGVLVLHLTPSFSSHFLDHLALVRPSGVVLVAFPSGTSPLQAGDEGSVRGLARLKKMGIPVVFVSQSRALAGGTAPEPMTYEAGRFLPSQGALWAQGLTLECAFVKLAWILGSASHSRSAAKVSQLWKKEIAGEFSISTNRYHA